MYDYATLSGSDAGGRTSGSVADAKLIVVANRQPYRHTVDDAGSLVVERPGGGLTAGLDPAMQDTGGTWIAWGDGEGDREAVDGDDSLQVPPEDPRYTLTRVWLDEAQVEGYYYGFANQVLWPICHSAITKVHCEPSYWHQYRAVNERFAEAVADRYRDGTTVWLHDYHLALAPRLIRRRLPGNPGLMHFWHVPWPAWETFRACPHESAVLDGLLGNDLLGFHLERYARNFMTCAEAALEEATVDRETNCIEYRDHVTRLIAAPMGVDTEEIREAAGSRRAKAFGETFASAHDIDEGTRIAVGADRLDYTKGIPERLRALERLWSDRPEWHGKLTYVQSASESRSRIPAYRDVQETVAEAVDRLNDRFGTDDWQPVVYVTEWLAREELLGLYRLADVGIVSPIRDGMNLVAQEYVAAQSGHDGVLLLSDQAGASEALGEFALTVDPYEVDEFAEAIDAALTMSIAERRRRMAGLRRRVTEIDLSNWTDVFHRRAADLSNPDPLSNTA